MGPDVSSPPASFSIRHLSFNQSINFGPLFLVPPGAGWIPVPPDPPPHLTSPRWLKKKPEAGARLAPCPARMIGPSPPVTLRPYAPPPPLRTRPLRDSCFALLCAR